MCRVVFCFQFAIGRWMAGWRRLQGTRQARAHFPHCKSFSFPLSLLVSHLILRLFFYSLAPDSSLPSFCPRPLAVSFISSWLMCVCSRLLLSSAVFIILSFLFLCICNITLSFCPVSFSTSHTYKLGNELTHCHHIGWTVNAFTMYLIILCFMCWLFLLSFSLLPKGLISSGKEWGTFWNAIFVRLAFIVSGWLSL